MSAVSRAVRSFPARSSSEGRRLGSAHYRQGQREAVLEGSESTGCRPSAFQASFPRRLVTLARTKGAVVWVKHRPVRLEADASRRSIFAHHGQYANGQGGSERPTKVQLRRLFVQAAVPMIGFGFMDNMVMITMGDLIDNSLGITFGLSTLTAAAIGQIFSDVSGVCFGGTVEALCSRLGLPSAALTSDQAHLKISKLCATAGAACGVILGCLLGMSTLLLHDSQKTEERKREKEFQNMIENENRDEIQVYVNKLQGELRQAEKALLHSERALVRLTPLVSSDEEAKMTEKALRKINRIISQDTRQDESTKQRMLHARTSEEALSFLKKRISTAIPQDIRVQIEAAKHEVEGVKSTGEKKD